MHKDIHFYTTYKKEHSRTSHLFSALKPHWTIFEKSLKSIIFLNSKSVKQYLHTSFTSQSPCLRKLGSHKFTSSLSAPQLVELAEPVHNSLDSVEI